MAALVDDTLHSVARPTTSGVESSSTLRARPGDRSPASPWAAPRPWSPARPAASVLHWELGDEPRLTDVSPVGDGTHHRARAGCSATRLLVAGDARGRLSAWFRGPPARRRRAGGSCARTIFPTQAAPVTALGPGARDKSFPPSARTARSPLLLDQRAHARERFRATACPPPPPSSRPRTTACSCCAATSRSAVSPSRIPHPEIDAGERSSARLWYEGYAAARVRLAVDRRHERLRAQAQPDAADLRDAQGHVLRPAVRRPAGRARRALHLAVRAPGRQGQDQARRSRSWPRCPPSWSASSPGSGWRRSSSATCVAVSADGRRPAAGGDRAACSVGASCRARSGAV